MKTRYFIFFIALFGVMGFSLPWPFASLLGPAEKFGTYNWFNQRVAIIHQQAANLDVRILKLGLKAYINAHKNRLDNSMKEVLTIIDYSKPSSQRRLWVIDMRSKKVLYNTWVTHGKNSGMLSATSFSNQPGSLKSSFGVFVTDGAAYMGNNGYSLRLKGLEQGFNNNAYRRDIVFHGAWYANPDIIGKYGQLGRSFGCPAVSMNIAKPLINTIKNYTVVFVYYPDQVWLRRSTFLA